MQLWALSAIRIYTLLTLSLIPFIIFILKFDIFFFLIHHYRVTVVLIV